MTDLANPVLAPILAQLSSGQLARTFQQHQARETEVMPGLITAAVMVLALVVVWLLIIRNRQRRRPLELFIDLCALHSVGKSTERKLLHIARSHRVTEPALLFVCPDLVKEIQSFEASEAGSDKERQRLETFFSNFMTKVFG